MKKLIIFLSILTINKNKIKYCDIKGNINNPGVYIVEKNDTIQDIINKSGGLKNNSYTDNINLSKKVTDEMVIYIATKKEIESLKKLNNCDCSNIYVYIECEEKNEVKELISTTTTTKEVTTKSKITTTKEITTKKTTTTKKVDEIIEEEKLVNINTCTLDDLIKLKGLGTKKAEKIIEYRNNNGNFESIEDIMKVSGIGQTTFNEIKEYIEI